MHTYNMCVHENIIIKCNKQFSLRLSPIHADIIHAIIISFHFIYIYCAHIVTTHILHSSPAYNVVCLVPKCRNTIETPNGENYFYCIVKMEVTSEHVE